MSLKEEYERVEAGKALKTNIDTVAGKITEIRNLLDELVGYRTIYPTAVTEIDTDLAGIVAQIAELAERYRKA